ncbi:MAG: septal ring lytic transglycosylase RlpA family protein [Nevskiaceae bacterium]|nr:MAG: septal ring lytic transglycosylase RlpA family protein [Nevskiaceae bacterium]TBR72702.1 MAG: septal ring lytic transglycosylase RlpA family protein [Nevskiaceae bacterium]
MSATRHALPTAPHDTSSENGRANRLRRIFPPTATLLKGLLLAVAVVLAGCSTLAPHPSLTRPSSIARGFVQTGYASWYGKKFQGRKTASGERYDMYKLTAASQSIPLFSRVEVKNLVNGKSVIVVINDRGPVNADRIIDLSYAAAKKIDIISDGTARIRLTVLSVP